ncbi:MAG: molybdopterin-dependent oxidoreductase [Actinomycetota bacterium]|nr:molybdopterin-dependent oxidoreductase [Actinomycetota bacterium]
MNIKLRAFVAGLVGMAVALGVAELVHGFYEPVPSLPVAVSQRLIVLMPASITEVAIGLLGEADIPVLVTTTLILTLVFAGLLARLALRSVVAALVGVIVLGAIGIAASLFEPAVRLAAAVLTVVGALGVGAGVSGFLMYASGLRSPEVAPPSGPSGSNEGGEPQGSRSREAGSGGGIAVSRRNFVVLSGTAAVAGLVSAGAGRLLIQQGVQATGATTPGGGLSTARQTLPPAPEGASIDAPGMPNLFTPNENFYLIDTAISPPRINRDNWTLSVKGEVDNPIELSYDELLSLPTREADITLSCISNEVGGGLVSNARWTGVLLSDVLEEAGLSRDKISSASEQLVGRSADEWTAGFPCDLAFDGREALVAFGMNDDELPLDHGYPVRLVVPGLYGYVSATKWLTEIELTDWNFDAYWIKRGWSKEGPILTQSRIDTLKRGDRPQAGPVQVGGVAWAPTRGIERVEVSTDDGETWNDATLATQLDVDAWRLWIYDWDARPGEHTIKVRATDGNGETQTEEETAPHPSGATGYHTLDVTVV